MKHLKLLLEISLKMQEQVCSVLEKTTLSGKGSVKELQYLHGKLEGYREVISLVEELEQLHEDAPLDGGEF